MIYYVLKFELQLTDHELNRNSLCCSNTIASYSQTASIGYQYPGSRWFICCI